MAYLAARRGAPHVRRHDAERDAEQVGDVGARADRRGRRDHAVELPVRDPDVEDDARAGGGQHRGVQAGRTTRPRWPGTSRSCFEEAGLPPGVLNLVFGDGPEGGVAARPAPGHRRSMSFTGSTEVGLGDRRRVRGKLGKRVLARDGRQERDHRAGRRRSRARRRRDRVERRSAPRASAARRASRVIVHEQVHDELLRRRHRARARSSSSATGSIQQVRGRPAHQPHARLDTIDAYVKIGAGEGATTETGGERRDRGRARQGLLLCARPCSSGVTAGDARRASRRSSGPVLSYREGREPRGGDRGQQPRRATDCRPRSSPAT